jgi:hypothetical protein
MLGQIESPGYYRRFPWARGEYVCQFVELESETLAWLLEIARLSSGLVKFLHEIFFQHSRNLALEETIGDLPIEIAKAEGNCQEHRSIEIYNCRSLQEGRAKNLYRKKPDDCVYLFSDPFTCAKKRQVNSTNSSMMRRGNSR